MKVLRIYHAGRDPSHRERDRALVRAGADVTLVVPSVWPGADELGAEPFRVVELPVRRAGDVNRHRFEDAGALATLVEQLRPDVVDVHEEPFSSVMHQVLGRLPGTQAVVGYTAQNLDKRFPPPFAQWERRALARLDGLYPCTRQAASVAVGKGFGGSVRVLPLGLDPAIRPGSQSLVDDPELRLLIVGRLVPEKGIRDAVEVLARLRSDGRKAELTIIGAGPEEQPAVRLAGALGVSDAVTLHGWADAETLADHYRGAHVLLAPSRSTRTWVEQFGRMVTEAQGSGAVVVGYASGSLPEVVGEPGVLVPEGDVDALTAAVSALARNPWRWGRLRTEGLTAARACHWDAIAAGQLELYDAALAGGRGVRRVRTRRAAAQREYGAPAELSGTPRPFALPILRDDHALSRTLERVADRLQTEPAEPAGELRVVHLDHTAKLSGGEIALERLVAAGSSERPHVILAEDGPLRERLERAGATVELLPLSSEARAVTRGNAVGLSGVQATTGTIGYTLRLARRLRQLRPDVVHTNSLKAGYYGTLAARLAGVPVVWHVRDRIAEDYMPRRTVRLTRALLQRLPDVVVANSHATAETTGMRSRVVSDPYQPRRLPAAAQREGYEIAVVGRISPWKGQDVVLRALAQVPDITARFLGEPMFGEDRYAASLRDLATELGIADRVTWVGFTDDVERHLAEVDVVVHSSTTPEPFGQVVVEAMAAGRPVIATNAGGPAEIITHDVNGLLTTPGDPTDLAHALETLRDPTHRTRLATAALTRAQDYTPDQIAHDMTEVWRDAVRARGGRPGRPAPELREGARLRVVFLDHTARLSGGEIALERLVAAGSSEQPHVILAEDGPLRERLERAGAVVELLPLAQHARDTTRYDVTGFGGLRSATAATAYTLRVARRLRQLRPDVVHTNSLKAGYYGAIAARLAGVPVVWHVRDRIAEDYMPRRAVRLTRALLQRLPDVVVANSQATADTTGVTAFVVPSPYAARLAPSVRDGGWSYEIAVVGRISPWKGQDVVLRALAQVPDITARFLGEPMFGEDRYAASLRDLATELGIADRVTWVGFTDDVEGHLAEVDVVVHSSTTPEPFGQVVVEAMAAGRPVIATNAGGPAEIITHDVNGLLTTPGDPTDLAHALETLRDPTHRTRLATAALTRAQDYTPDQIAHDMAEVWREAIRRRGPRRLSRWSRP